MKSTQSTEDMAWKPATLLQAEQTTETTDSPNGHLTSGRLLARNTVWNLLGSGAPMIVAVFCIPILIRGLGKERFGVLTLAWPLMGYASPFEPGLAPPPPHLLPKKLPAPQQKHIPSP